MRRIEVVGDRYGRLVVLREGPKSPNGFRKVFCRCDCGNEKLIWLASMRIGDIRSCGCFQQESRGASQRTHGEGHKETKEYKAWLHAKERCYNPRIKGFHNYGGRGVRMCEKWLLSYEAFLADMGRSPSKSHTLDRINCHGHYEPGNCRWATMKQQANNKQCHSDASKCAPGVRPSLA